ERLLERMKLPPQRVIDSRAGLVSRPQIVPKRFDDVIGGHADMRCSAFEHLHDRPKHARHCPERRIVLAKTPDAVEVPEQFVRAIDEVDDHSPRTVPKKLFTRSRGDAERARFSPPLRVSA